MAQRFAHTVPGRGPDDWEPLDAHLSEVADLAHQFASPFGAGRIAALAGLWHDLGKYSPEFQRYLGAPGSDADEHLETKPGRVDHSTAGAQHAVEALGPLGKVLAYAIAGHHAGLPDAIGGPSALESRLGRRDLLERVRQASPPAEVMNHSLPDERPPSKDPKQAHLWIRLLFSCLVDADYLATERFLDKERTSLRGGYPDVSSFIPQFTEFMTRFATPSTKVELARSRVLEACLTAAQEPQGLFSLTVPTGGGKTLASLAFALHHARRHGLRRVIYVIPYTSIIEQTGEVLRRLFGESVIEHQSNLDWEDPVKASPRARLAAENWDAPFVVTTNVQFFESLYAAKSSRCRKLHRIVKSVVILDEAQLLPPEHLDPVRCAIQGLAQDYGVTFVLSTATQPALRLEGLREIAPDPAGLVRELERVSVSWPTSTAGVTWPRLATELSAEPQVLCIVDRRDDARELAQVMPPGTLHLSALMCGEHRSRTIATIRAHLAAREPVRVVSTQLVEAGVDLDFPVVYRAFSGLVSIAQAAGRCNREGRLAELGRVVVFNPPRPPPRGLLAKAEATTRELRTRQMLDFGPAAFEAFFESLYWKVPSHDAAGVLPLLTADSQLNLQFRTAAETFSLIPDEGMFAVCVRYGRGHALVDELMADGPNRLLLRRLQRFCVSVHRKQVEELMAAGALEPVVGLPRLLAQTKADDRIYDPRFGLMMGVPEFDPLIA